MTAAKKATKKKPRQGFKKYGFDWLIDLYDAAIRDEDLTRIAAAVGISRATLDKRHKLDPQVRKVLEKANERRGPGRELSQYVFKHLSPDAKKIWDELMFWNEHEDASEKIHHLMLPCPKRIRQELYIHALIHSNFDHSSALRMTGTTRNQVDYWARQDLEFQQLCEEIEWHKKNFFERALLDLVEEKHPSAVLFANRTINADRGYNEKLSIEHSGKIAMGPGIRIDELNLSLACRREILTAIREKKKEEDGTVDINEVKPALKA